MKKINLFIIMCFISSIAISQPFNNFLSLDGVDDYANHNFSGSNIPSGDFTLEFWIYSCGYGQGSRLIDAAGSTAGGGLEINYLHNMGGVMSLTMRGGATSNPATYLDSSPAGTNAWHHFALTYNGTTKLATIFVDGQLDDTTTVSFFGPSARFWIGRRDHSASGFLKADLDELRISDVIRYTSNFTPQTSEFTNDANTYALYHFNGTTTNLVDASSNSYNLTAMTPGAIPVSSSLATPASINAIVSGQNTFCVGDSTYIKVNASSTLNDNTVWRWYSSSCGGTLVAEGDSIIVKPTTTTMYYVRGELGCAANSTCQSVTITVNQQPTVTANATQTTICEGDSAQLTGSGAVSYIWDNSVINGDYVSPANSTTYTVIGTDANTCSDTDQVTITVNPMPTVTIAAFNDDTICTSTGAVGLPAGSPSGGTYSGTGVSGGNFNPQTSGAGTFDVIYTYTNGFNCSSSDTTQITVEVCTGIDVKENIKLSVAPNPFTNSLKLNSLPSGSLVQLIDISGKLIYEQVTSNTSMFIDTQKLEKGMYFLRVTSDNEINTTRVIKQ